MGAIHPSYVTFMTFKDYLLAIYWTIENADLSRLISTNDKVIGRYAGKLTKITV